MSVRVVFLAASMATVFVAPRPDVLPINACTVYTSTRTVTAVHTSADGTLWVGTRGGVRRKDARTGTWQTFTRADGLPSHEVRGFAGSPQGTVVVFADGTAARWSGGGVWEPCAAVLIEAQTLPVGEMVPPNANEPADHNAQAVAFFGGTMYVSTLRDGSVTRDATGAWAQVLPPTISSDAPRQMLVFGDALYVRHGSGAVDRLRGGTWARNIWTGDLPRKQVSALATDGKRIFAAQWGGVSVYDGKTWTHFLREPGLQGVPITTLLPVGDTLYAGTQGRGLAELDAATGHIRRWWNEANGLPDDWIIALAENGGTLYAGTFVGGLAVRIKGAARFALSPGTAGENVTDLLSVAGGGVVATTRFGAKTVNAPGVTLPALVTGRTVETQCVGHSPDGDLWIGTRTGLYRIKP